MFSTIAPADSVEFELLRQLRKKTYICSPTGQILKLDMRAIVSFTCSAEFQFYYLEQELGEKRPPDHFAAKFSLFDWPLDEYWTELGNKHNNPKGLLPWKLSESLGLDRRHHLIPLYFERQGYTLCFEAYDLLRPQNYMEMDPVVGVIDVLRRFEGWAMCAPDSIQGPEWARMWQHFIEQQRGPSIGPTEGVGRPPDKRIATANAYASIYPDGHGDEAWLRVLGRVNEVSGYCVSVDTLRRAVRMLEAHKETHNRKQKSEE